MNRRYRVLAWASTFVLGILDTYAAHDHFDFARLQERAKNLAATPHVSSKSDVPEWMRRLSYDQLRQIEFDGRESRWLRDHLPFQVQFLHPGFLYDRTVRISELHLGRVEPIPFRREYFDYRAIRPGEIPRSMGFAGFRLMYRLAGPTASPSEVGSFLGASYFRFLCQGAAYGLSARGLALDTGEPVAEEFPLFTEFWIERPGPEAGVVKVYALLESESVTGAYRFAVSPGNETSVHVKAALFLRNVSKVPGVAPLTSMFWHGENTNTSMKDYRPEVHDSDGLLIHNGAGEWLWRPLENPRHLRVTTFTDRNPRGFGLLQRDRNFENYQDLEALYHARPSAWIEPVGDWGSGAIRLVEIPTSDEFSDNIVALWVPAQRPLAGQPIVYEYRVHWTLDRVWSPTGTVRATRHGRSANYEPGLERFVIDFDGPQLRSSSSDRQVEPIVTVGAGAKLNHAAVQKNSVNGTWRLAFTVRPAGTGQPVELRCFLRSGGHALTETWSYLWQP